MRIGGSVLVLWLGGALLFSSQAFAGPLRSSSGVSVSMGDYGTAEDTTITELYQSFVFQGRRGEIGVTLPYLFRNGNGVTAGESSRVRSSAIPEDANGLGDVQAAGKYFWLEETDSRPALDLGARVKFPTASEDKGLGTGRFDVGFGPKLLKHFGSLITFADFELLLRDKPSGSTIRSTRFDYAVGIGYPLTPRLTAYGSLEGGTPSSSGAEAPLEVVLSAVYKATETIHLNGFVLAGLTDGSPDFGAGTGVTFYF